MNGERRGDRIYRAMLRLFPARFRRVRGAAMAQLFRDMVDSRRQAGRRAGLVFWVVLLWDTLNHAMRERIAPALRAGGRHIGGGVMTTMGSDVRFALRSMGRRPQHAVLTVLLMMLAIAGNTAVFRLYNGLFLRPLPYESPDRLVDVDETAPQWDLTYVGVAYADFDAWRRDNTTFEGMGAYSRSSMDYTTGDAAVHVEVVRATFDLTTVLGVNPVAGRPIAPSEDVPNGGTVALLTHSFWQSQYAGREDVIGTTIRLSGESYEVIGILPREADHLADAGVWLPLQDQASDESGWYLQVVGRLAPGATVEQARDDLTRIHRSLLPGRESNDITSPVVNPMRDRYLGDLRLGSSVLLGSVALVLLIACANIAGLTLAQSLGRAREMGIRVALGASSRRILRQLLTESVMLAVAGATLGVAAGSLASSALVTRMQSQFPRWVTFDLDWRFVLFTIGVTAAAAVLFGLAPALQSARADVSRLLHGTSTRMSAGAGRRRNMRGLVVFEVALAMVLLIAAGLGVRDFRALLRIDPGFRTDHVLSYRLSLPPARYNGIQRRVPFWEEHLRRIRSLPGVVSVAAASALPLNGHWGWAFEVEGAPPSAPGTPNPAVLNRVVSPDYFETMGVQVLAGRAFDEHDGRDAGSPTVIVDESFVREFLGDEAQVPGRRIRSGGGEWLTIIGVARDVHHYGVDQDTRPGVYQPLGQLLPSGMQVAVLTSVPPASLLDAVRASVREQDPEIAPHDIATMTKRYDDALWTRRASAWLIGLFSSVALVMAVAGLYGVISCDVTQRTHEISIRMALGAGRGQVVRRIIAEGVSLVAIGAIIGLGAAAVAARSLSAVLLRISPTDPVTWIGVTALLLVIAFAANLVPARRAAGLQPMHVLAGD